MNGFSINPYRWYFDYFAYEIYRPDGDDPDWLCSWNSEDWPDTTLHGLEAVQEDYHHYSNGRGWKDPDEKVAASYAAPLVMCRFAELIRNAVDSRLVQFRVPILATAHDFEIIPEFLPVATT
jgi:hypothetical protein